MPPDSTHQACTAPLASAAPSALRPGPDLHHTALPCPAEKNLKVIKKVLEANPGARLALVGDGPQRQELEQHFAGMPVKFMVRVAARAAP
jgi:hypothetical protein